MGLEGQVAFITGASRGIGRAIAERLARAGVHCVIAAKTVAPHPRLPGTIGDVAEACRAAGAEALALPVDVRRPAELAAAVERAVSHFGRLDIAIHNAGALWWKPIADTPIEKFDLVMEVNVRGAFALAHAALPHLVKSGGHFIAMGAPLDPAAGAPGDVIARIAAALPGKTAYLISKSGMTMVARGLAGEQPKIASNSLWPETLIQSSATENFGLGGPAFWYKADLVADAVFELVSAPRNERPTGRDLLVLEYLRERGYTDFTAYRCDPDREPPIIGITQVPRAGGNERADGKSLN